MLDAILSFLFLCMGLLSIYTIPIGFIYSVIFGILLLCANNKQAVQKKHLPIISFIFLPASIIIAMFFILPFLDRGAGASWNLRISWELILIPLMINTLLLLGWIFCREILSSAYYLLWTIVLLISAGLGIGALLIGNFL